MVNSLDYKAGMMKKGFTLIEIVIVMIVIVLILNGLVFKGRGVLQYIKAKNYKQNFIEYYNKTLSLSMSTFYVGNTGYNSFDINLSGGSNIMQLKSGTDIIRENAFEKLIFSGFVKDSSLKPEINLKLSAGDIGCSLAGSNTGKVMFETWTNKNKSCFEIALGNCKLKELKCDVSGVGSQSTTTPSSVTDM